MLQRKATLSSYSPPVCQSNLGEHFFPSRGYGMAHQKKHLLHRNLQAQSTLCICSSFNIDGKHIHNAYFVPQPFPELDSCVTGIR